MTTIKRKLSDGTYEYLGLGNAAINEHIASTSNPHAVTATQVGATTETYVNSRVGIRIPIADDNYGIATTNNVIIAITSITAARTITLPAATSSGQIVTIIDESGSVTPTNSITVARAGSDTIDGLTSYTIARAYSRVRLISNGVSNWSVMDYEPVRTPIADAAYTITSRRDCIISYTSITASRIVTLPAATNAGQRIVIVDGSGSCSATNTIVITRAGSDTINGATTYTLSTAYGSVTLLANGTTNWVTTATNVSSSGSIATDTIWDAAGDLVVGTGNNTSSRLTMGTALQQLRVNAGATGLEFATISSIATTIIQRSLEGVVYETSLMYWVAPATCVISTAIMALSSNPSASSTYCKVQVMKNGILETNSIFTSDTPMQITEVTSATNGIYQASGTLDSGQTSLAAGDVLHFRVNQADTGCADLLIQVKVNFT